LHDFGHLQATQKRLLPEMGIGHHCLVVLTVLHEPRKVPVRVLEELRGSVELDQAAGVKHHHPVAVQHGVEPVGDGDDGACGELRVDDLLDPRVRLEVQAGSGCTSSNAAQPGQPRNPRLGRTPRCSHTFVHDKDLGAAKQAPREAQQLLLARREHLVGRPRSL
jgi:hypothetical protein